MLPLRLASPIRDFIWAFVIIALLGPNPADATEWVQETGDFLISRDFQRFKIPAAAPVLFQIRTRWGAELPDQEIRNETRRVLANRITFVNDPAEAQYGLQIRLEEYVDYATRNSDGRPATGFVMFAICSFPFEETSRSCQNLTFYYFEDAPRLTMFRRAADAWLSLIVE